jgi:hypothetical protein
MCVPGTRAWESPSPDSGYSQVHNILAFISALEIADCPGHGQLHFVVAQVLHPGAEFLGFYALQYHDPFSVPIDQDLSIFIDMIGKDVIV